MSANHRPYRLEQVRPAAPDSPLLRFAKNVASQNGEDGVIERIFELVPPVTKFCVEFGAWDGKFMSNCWNLVSHHGWSGCFIEGNNEKFKELRATYAGNPRVTCLNRFVEIEGERSLDRLLASVSAPASFDLLSIDVDGTDWFIWESLKNHKPSIVVIEFNPTIPNDVIFVQAKSAAVNQGCSLMALVELGRQKGYELIACTGWNAFFARADIFPRFGIRDNSVGRLYQPMMDGRIFHGYDSYVYVVGMPYFAWSGVRLESADFQVVPAAARVFGDAQNR